MKLNHFLKGMEFTQDEAEALADTLSGDDRFWALIHRSLMDKPVDLNLEIPLLAFHIWQEIQEATKEEIRTGEALYCGAV